MWLATWHMQQHKRLDREYVEPKLIPYQYPTTFYYERYLLVLSTLLYIKS